jgi:hypothetical protein
MTRLFGYLLLDAHLVILEKIINFQMEKQQIYILELSLENGGDKNLGFYLSSFN